MDIISEFPKITQSPVRIHNELTAIGMMANGTLPPQTILIGVHRPLMNLHLCQVSSLDQDFRPVGNGMVFRKRWPYTKILDYYFLEVNQRANRSGASSADIMILDEKREYRE